MLALILASGLSGCCASEPQRVPDERVAPALPVRPRPRASLEQLQAWVEAGRPDEIVLELLIEQAWSDEVVRRGRWAK